MTTAPHKTHIAHQLIHDLQELPLWVKQVIYLELQQELMVHFAAESMENLTPNDTVAFYIPKLTADGESQVLDQKNDIGKLLMDARQQYTILDICLRNEWSLEACSVQMMAAIEANYIHPPQSVKAMGTFEYLANRIRLGEYLVKMGRITVEQLEQALRTQQYIKESLQEHTGLANILINLGYITRQDTEGILFLKEECRKSVQNIALLKKLA